MGETDLVINITNVFDQLQPYIVCFMLQFMFS